ncbi:MAG: aminoacyl-tRNA hydrolase [Clostridia bacterium]|nr:aminoacyl-tRNA hydrolase [Clostridia bacterium]
MNREVMIVVGLGNPGADYAHTRHNAGFDTMTLLEKKYGVTLGRKALQGLLAEITDGEKKIVLCMPQTYMNNSGECVSQLLHWYKAEPDHLLVIYDDIDLPPGKVRVRREGGPGTHNGMRSIVEHIGTTAFPRIRVGTGDRPAGGDLVKWVLGHYDPETQKVMDEAFRTAADAAEAWVEKGIDAAMRAGNTGPHVPPKQKKERLEDGNENPREKERKRTED